MPDLNFRSVLLLRLHVAAAAALLLRWSAGVRQANFARLAEVSARKGAAQRGA